MSAQFPTVPPFPGVPNLARSGTPASVSDSATTSGANAALATQLGLPVTVIFGNSPLFSSLNLQPFDPSYSIKGAATMEPDSMVELDLDASSSIMTHPVEQGGFDAYNRVQAPIKIRMLLACQGINMPRTGFLSALEGMREGTDLYTISTPDTTYYNMALKGYSYKKAAERGAVTIWADTQWEEARSTNVTVSTTSSVQPQGASTSDLGPVNSQSPVPSLYSIINSPPVTPSPLPADVASETPPSGAAF